MQCNTQPYLNTFRPPPPNKHGLIRTSPTNFLIFPIRHNKLTNSTIDDPYTQGQESECNLSENGIIKKIGTRKPSAAMGKTNTINTEINSVLCAKPILNVKQADVDFVFRSGVVMSIS